MWCLEKSFMVKFVILTLTILFTCQDVHAQSQYREYTLDSLRCFDQLETICEKIIGVLGQPREIIRFSIYQDCLGYNRFQIVMHERQLWALEKPFEEGIQKINIFLEKYKNRKESSLISYSHIQNTIFRMEKIFKCLKSVSHERRFMKDEFSAVEGCRLFDQHLGEYICAVNNLRFLEREGLWLLTSEEVKNKFEVIKKELEKSLKERARRLEEKSKPPKK